MPVIEAPGSVELNFWVIFLFIIRPLVLYGHKHK